jgi:hypothetical protein
MRYHCLCVVLCSMLLPACSSKPVFVEGCEPSGKMEPICQFTNPEDIELLPDGKTFLISQMGMNMEQSAPGSLVFFDPTTRTVTSAQPASGTPMAEDWGAPNCPGNPHATIAPHGTSLRKRGDGRWQLAVVNHGGRESIEMFELLATEGKPSLAWRGCVPAEDGVFMNDVAVLKNGGFIASHMFDKRSPHIFNTSTGGLKALFGIHTGYVFEWQKTTGFRVLEGSHGPMPNGVEISADDNTVFANIYFGDEMLKLDRVSGKRLGSVPITRGDNLAWDSKGALLVVSHTASTLDQLTCMKQPGRTCSLEYKVLRINPETLTSELILTHAGAPMGAATVARELNGSLYLGTYTGDRIVKIPYQ